MHLITSLKDQSLRKLEFKNENEVGNEKVIFKKRSADFEISKLIKREKFTYCQMVMMPFGL